MHRRQRHLGRRDQPQVVALDVVGVVGELRQMPGRRHRLGQHQGGRADLLVGRRWRSMAKAVSARSNRAPGPGRAGTSSPTAGRRAPCRGSAAPRRSPSAAPAGARAARARAARGPGPGHHRRTSTLSSSPMPVGRVVGRDVGEVEQPGAHRSPHAVGLGRGGPLLLTERPALAPQLLGPVVVARLLACPTWRDSSLTSARRASALLRGPARPRRPRSRRRPRPPRRRAGQCGLHPVGVVAQRPDIDHAWLKVACDAVPAVQVTRPHRALRAGGYARRRRRART